MIHVATWIGWNGVWNPCFRRADDEDGDAGGSSQPAQQGGVVVVVVVLVELLVHPQSASHPASAGMFQCVRFGVGVGIALQRSFSEE